jgi:hypothetical protein
VGCPEARGYLLLFLIGPTTLVPLLGLAIIATSVQFFAFCITIAGGRTQRRGGKPARTRRLIKLVITITKDVVGMAEARSNRYYRRRFLTTP